MAGDPIAATAWVQSIADVHGFPHAIVVYCAKDLGPRARESPLGPSRPRAERERAGRDTDRHGHSFVLAFKTDLE